MTSLELFRALILAMPVTVVDDATVTQFLASASGRLDATCYGDKWAEASVWLAAHMLATSPGISGLSAPGFGGGTVTSLKTGDESVGFSSPSLPSGATLNDAWLAQTSYGMNFAHIRDTRACAAPQLIEILC